MKQIIICRLTKLKYLDLIFFIIIIISSSFKQKLQQDTLEVISKFQRVLYKRFEEFRSGSWIRLPFQALVVLPITSHSLLNYYFSCLGITRLQLTLLTKRFLGHVAANGTKSCRTLNNT